MRKRSNPRFTFHCTGGRKFLTLLQKVSGDDGIGVLFLDNLRRYGRSDEGVIYWVSRGKYDMALGTAFDWDDSNENKEFWADIYKGLMEE